MKLGSLLVAILVGLSTISAPNHARPIHKTSFIVQANTLSHSTYLTGPVAFSTDGKWLACGSGERDVAIWDVNRRTVKHILHPDTIFHNSATFSPDSKILATGGHDHDVRLWDMKTGKLLKTLKGYSNRVYRMAFTPDGNALMAATYHGYIEFWNLRSGARKHDSQAWRASDLSVSPDGKSVAIARNYLARGTRIQGDAIDIYNVRTGLLRKTISVSKPPSYDSGSLYRVAFSPNGKLIASARINNVDLWDARSGKLQRTIHLPETDDDYGWLCFQPDGKTLISARQYGTIDLWSVDSGKMLKAIDCHNKLEGFALSPDGATMALPYKGVIHLQSLR